MRLTVPGWQRFEQLNRGSSNSRKAFMAMQYSDPEMDEIVNKHFRSAVRQQDFDLTRLDDRLVAGLIDDRLRVQIQTSRFLIADLTTDNRGAYWEAGFAEGLGKPVIYTCKKAASDSGQTHFDTNHHLTVKWEKDKLSAFEQELKATIRATMPSDAKLTDD